MIEELDTVYIAKENKTGTVVDINRFGRYTVECTDDNLPIGAEGKHILVDCLRDDIRLVHKGAMRTDDKSDGAPTSVFCPVMGKEIADIDCIENHDNRFPALVYDSVPECESICRKCEWHDF